MSVITQINQSITGSRLPLAGSKISYNNYRKLFRNLLLAASVGPDEVQEFGIYSLRSGSATAASWGVSELELQQHGRWKTREAALSYIQRTEAQYERVPGLLLEQVLAV